MADDEKVDSGKGESTQIMVRVTPDIKKRIQDQVQQGKFTTYSDFCRTAMYEKLNREEYMSKFHEMLIADFDNPTTRAKFRKILAEMLSFEQ